MPNDDNRPQPPQPDQRQAPPGTTKDMDPAPDHGEHSYKGSGRLAGKVAIITGADSGSAEPWRSLSRARVPMS